MIWFKKQSGIDGYRLDAIKHFPSVVTEDVLFNVQTNAGFASGTDQMLAIGEWVGGKSELDAWVGAVQNRAGTFDFGLRGFSSGPGLYAMVYGFGNYDMSNLPGLQQNSRYRTAPFVNNHDTFRPNDPSTGNIGLDTAGNYPVNANGTPRRWFSNSELATNIDPREPRLTAAYAVAFSVDGHPNVFFEDLFDIGTKGNRYTHLPQSDTGLPVRQSIANIIKCHKKFDFKSGAYRVRTSAQDNPFFDGSSAQDVLIIERSGKAIIAINDNFTTDQAVWIDCDFAIGTVLKDYTGNFPNVTVVTRQNGPGGRVRVIAPKCNGVVNNTINKGVAIYAPASLESFFNLPFPISERTTTHEWELADDLGDSDPRSLRQGGALPANSTDLRWAGKVYAQAGKTITYKLFPSFPTRNLTVYVTNECGVVLDSVKGIGILTKTFTPVQTAWYQFRAKNSLDTNREQRVWVNVTYTGPDSINALTVKSRILPFVELGPDRYGCIGSNVNLNATFGPGLNYSWRDSTGTQIGVNPNISLNKAGRYTVTLTDPQNGCTTTDRIRIISFESPPPNSLTTRIGDTIKVVNITPGVDYSWRINGVTNPNDTLPYLIVPGNAVTINLVSRNSFGCIKVTSNLVSILNLLEDDGSIRLYPNPAREFLTIEYAGNKGALKTTILDLKGAIVRQEEISNGEAVTKQISLKGLKPGLYLVKIQNGNLFRTAKLSIQ
jgi:alpha-amylase